MAPKQSSNLWYPGWRVMAGGFICAMLAVGGTIYVFGLFVVPVSEAFNLSRADANNGLILNMLGMAMWSPIMGKLLDRYSARYIMLFGAIMYACGFSIIAATTSLFYIFLAIVGPIAMAVTCAGALAANTVTARWFQQRRGRALGILAVSTSAGGFVMTPIFATLMEQFGWRDTLSIVAIAIPSCMILVIFLLIKDRPDSEDIAHFDEFQSSAANNNAKTNIVNENIIDSDQSWTFSQLARSRDFWFLCLGAGLLLGSDAALLATKVPYMLDQGISLSKAAFFVSCMTASAVCGKILVGILADKIDIRLMFGFVVACHMVLLATLIIMPSYWALLVVASVFGVAIGGVYPVWLLLTAKVFGAKTYGTVIGAMGIIIQPLSIIAIRFIGEVYDRTGDYSIGFMVFAGSAALSFLFIMQVRLPLAKQKV